MHDPTRGSGPCVFPDGHKGQHRSLEAEPARREMMKRWNRTGGVAASQRYRNRHPMRRAVTVINQSAKERGR